MTLPYFPAYATLAKAVGVDLNTLNDGEEISVKAGVLMMLLKSALAVAPFDEQAYLEFNPDLKIAQDEGRIEDLHKHYIENGYLEGRNAAYTQFDAEWYLSYYKDVALAVRDGAIASAQEHYEKAGEKEWRAPNGAASPVLQMWRSTIIGS